MNRTVVWTPVRWPGSEHTHVWEEAGAVRVDGMVIVAESRPVRLHYRLTCDQAWTTKRLELALYGGPSATLVRADDGTWSDDAGPRPDLAGCVDVDITVTPFTNTLPVRRLSLAPGSSADLRMAYVLVGPRLEVIPSEQRYTHLDSDAAGSLYRYESRNFQADLTVDADGLVTDYPRRWRQVQVVE